MVSRSDGYKASQGKEELGLRVVEGFFSEVLDVPLARIEDADDNYRFGDFWAPNGASIECKSQRIDPDQYPRNFVEIFEVTNNSRHEGGFTRVSEILGLSPSGLAEVRLKDRRTSSHRDNGASHRVGSHERVSVSITSIAAASYTAYVNSSGGGSHLYLYERSELLEAIRSALADGIVRGAGMSNDDTFAVWTTLACKRWRRVGGSWTWSGVGPEQSAMSAVRRDLV